MLNPPIPFYAPLCWRWMKQVQLASKHGLGSKAGPRRTFNFSNCELARFTRSICIQWYSITKWNRGAALNHYTNLHAANSLIMNLTSSSISQSRWDRWGTTEDLTANSLHPSLSSASLKASPSFRPVHSQMLFSHLFLCLPLALCPCPVPCKISYVHMHCRS